MPVDEVMRDRWNTYVSHMKKITGDDWHYAKNQLHKLHDRYHSWEFKYLEHVMDHIEDAFENGLSAVI